MVRAAPDRELSRSFFDALRPDETLSVSEWADRHRYLDSRTSKEHGRWRTSRTPYLRAVMDALSDPDIRTVVFMKGSQIGGTEVGNNFVGWVIHQQPGPMLVVQPSLVLSKRNVRQRIDPLIDSSPVLSARVAAKKSRDSANSNEWKEFRGGSLILAGANSASGLRSSPVRYVFEDEIDGYPEDCEGEGDPSVLAERGTRTFESVSKIFKTSTPTFEGRSRIAADFDATDQRFYEVPCPHCEHRQPITWSRIKWDKGKPETAHMECSECEGRIEEHHKTEMLEGGEWVPRYPERVGEVIGFHLSALYSPDGWFSWERAVRLWIRAQGNQERLRPFFNQVLGETWKDRSDPPNWKTLYRRRERYKRRVIPAGVCVVTAGVDVQADRLEYELVGWGRNLESWSVDIGQIPGDPTDLSPDGPWAELKRALGRQYEHELGGSMPVRVTAVDSGFETSSVYTWVRSAGPTVIAVKGMGEGYGMLVGPPSAVDVNRDGKRVKRGTKVWPVGTAVAKSELYGWLRQPVPDEGEPNPPGWCHFPQYAEEFFQQLTAEQLVHRIVRGYRRYLWEKTRERNEALDCRVYARAAAAVFGVDRWDDQSWDNVRTRLLGTAGKPAAKSAPKKSSSSFWDK